MIERIRPTLAAIWKRSPLGGSSLGQELTRRTGVVEDRVRAVVWAATTPLRRVEPVGHFLTWLSNVTKRAQPLPPQSRKTFLPDPEATLLEAKSRRLVLPTSLDPEVSIIVPVFNQFAFTYGCLRSIAAHTDGYSYEVIIVDDHSTDATATVLATVDGLRIVRNDKQLGFIGACNAGAAVARGRYVLFLNNDTDVRDGWLRELRRTFSDEPRAGLVGSKLVYPDGRLQEAGGIVWSNGMGWNVGRLADPDEPQFQYMRRVDYCSGACIMLPTKLFRALNGFDTHFAPAYYEDTDLAFRVTQAGYETLYQPRSEIVHFEGMTSGTDLKVGIKKHQVVNEKKF
ncbi:MAG TPA: glycosyltransferase family 2 protein, partial [Polyangia bacterium]|nr:glycosyltransferase family 2 protein [Polyangia bacterium]